MALLINGTEPSDVKVNGKKVVAVKENGVRIWPTDKQLSTGSSNIATSGWQSATKNDGSDGGGYSGWTKIIIPSSERSGKLSYVIRADIMRGIRGAVGDNWELDHRFGMRMYYVTDAAPWPYDVELVDLQKHGYFTTDNGFTYTVPEGRVVVGFQFRSYVQADGGDDNLGSFSNDCNVYVYTCKVQGVNRPFIMKHGSQSYNSDSQTDTGQNNDDFQAAKAYGNTLGGDRFMSGIHINTNVWNPNDDDDINLNKSVSLRNYYRSGTVAYND